MCGLVGVINTQGVDSQELASMTDVLAHRGPNDSGMLFYNASSGSFTQNPHLAQRKCTFGLGFRRLSILDLSSKGHQPMLSPDGRYAIVFNGEIYNFRELRDALIHEGYRFQSQTDTEVLLTLYAHEGPDMLHKLNGMFAIAIFDSKTEELFLARDRMGVKPLYYYVNGNNLLFSSEVKAFLFSSLFQSEVRKEALDEYLLFRYVAGTQTLLKGVHNLEPGTFKLIKNGQHKTVTYWKIPPHTPMELTERQAKEAFCDTMRSSIHYRLISDVKVGCQLSGGLDSSLVSRWAVEQHGEFFESFSITFEESGYSEQPFIDNVNQQLGLIGHKAILDHDYFLHHLESATWFNDFPINHPNSLGILKLATMAKKQVTVLLSGEGADEVFGGYQRFSTAAWFLRSQQYPALQHIPHWARLIRPYGGIEEAVVGISANTQPSAWSSIYPEFSSDRAIQDRRAIWQGCTDAHLLERMMSYEQKSFLPDLLMRQDRMSMAAGVETRVPFLDHRVVSFSKRLPTRFKIALPKAPIPGRSVFRTKLLVKETAATYFGKQFAYRPKCGFAVPVAEIFASPNFETFYQPLRKTLKKWGFFNMPAIDACYQQAKGGSRLAVQQLWIILSMAVWLRIWFDSKPSAVADAATVSQLA